MELGWFNTANSRKSREGDWRKIMVKGVRHGWGVHGKALVRESLHRGDDRRDA